MSWLRGDAMSGDYDAREDRELQIERIEARGFKIVTRMIKPPIPVRDYDWCAFLDGYEEKTSWQGWGRTQLEALDDLLDNLEF